MRETEEAQVSSGFVQFLDPDSQTPVSWTRLTIPQQGPAYLKRPRLIDALHNMIDRKLVLVRAPAGYGKTSLLVDLAYETDLPVCWYMLEEQSSDLGVFLTHLLASIGRRFPSFGKRSLGILWDMHGQIYTQLRIFVATLVDEILNTIPEYFFLILDDYHALDPSSTVHEFVRLFIDFVPEQCHMIIASRTVPPLPLIRLTARQQMAAIGVDELRFTEQEIAELTATKLRIALPTDQTRFLTQQTDGWITAVLLSADTGWSHILEERDTSKIDFTETSIYDYLMSEVFNSQPDKVQRFLLDTAVLDEMTVPLCSELLGQECRSMLRTLERHSLFISRVEQSGLETAYRYHPLFRDFLRSRLRREDEHLYRDLHTRAAGLFAQRQDWHVALVHNLKAGRFAQVQSIILSHYSDLDMAGHRESLAQWIDSLPPEHQSASLQLTRATLANELGQNDTALRLYTNAIVHYESQDSKLDLAYALIERSYALSRSGSYEGAITDCQSALSLLASEPETDSLQGRAYRYLGMYYTESGDPSSALHFLSLAHQIWTECGESLENLARLAQTTGMTYEMLGQFAKALDQCQKAYSIWESLGNKGGMAEALNGVGVAYHRMGEYRTARETLCDALERSQTTGSIRLEAYCLTSQGDLYRDLAQFDQALAYYERAQQRNIIIGEAYLRSYIANVRAETLCLAGQLERAQDEIEHSLSHETLSKYHEAQQRITLAAVLLGQQKSQRARKELEATLLEPTLQNEITFRGHLELAQAAMLENRPQESEEHVRTAIQLAQEAGLTQPLSVASLNHIHVLEFVTEKRGKNQDLQKWITAAKELAKIRKELASEQAQEAVVSCPSLQIIALGGSRILQDDKSVAWRTTQAKELFFYLLTHPEGQTKEQIGAIIWPEHSVAKLASIFRSSLFRVRKALFSDIVVFDGERYHLNPQVIYNYDVLSFEKTFSKAVAADNLVQKAHHYHRAAELYRGEFLADLYADWVFHFREALQARYLQALTFLAQFNLDNHNYPQAISFARQILVVDEHHEIAYHILVKSYARSGQRPHAKRIYERYRDMLAEFGLEPEQDWEDLSQ